ncbi:MAG TPA: PilZ domain-containing protein [Terriglobales bacterium]|nr:PilZ domain-containing protein [Terriglobales bacterium]
MPKDLSGALSYSENRRSTRYKTDRFVVIQFQGRRVTGMCVDYNEDGFGAIIETDLPVGAMMAVEFRVAGREVTPLQVKTIYRKYSRYGFEFIAPEHSKRQIIADFFRESLEGDY